MLPDPRRTRAVLIGIDVYAGMPSMPAAASGARRLSRLLRDVWNLPGRHVAVLDAAASGHDILSTVRDAALAAEDTLLVYFAGHGLRDLDGESLYLCLTAADEDYPQVGTLPYRDLRRVIRQAGSNARYRLTVLDCCYSGLAGAMSAPGPVTRDELALALDEDPARDSDRTEVYGDVVLTSAPHDRQSYAPPGADSPEATGELIGILQNGIPGLGPELSVSSAWQRVRRRLVLRGRPEPQLFAQNSAADVLGFPNRATAVAPSTRAGETFRLPSGESPPVSDPDRTATDVAGTTFVVPDSAPEAEWQPTPVGRWRPEEETPYPGDSYFKQQLSHLYALDRAWAEVKKEFRSVRRRVHVPVHLRSPAKVASWLHESTGDARWLVIAESVKVLEDRRSGYTRTGVTDPYASQVPGGNHPPDWQLTAEIVDTYCRKVEQLCDDINRLMDLHTGAQD